MNYPVRSSFCVVLVMFSSLLFTSCPGEDDCDPSDYATPTLELLQPDTTDITVEADSMFTLVFRLKAEGGLNTLSINGTPLHAFLNGETDEVFEFSRYYWESREYLFVLHDRCNNSAELKLQISVNYPDI